MKNDRQLGAHSPPKPYQPPPAPEGKINLTDLDSRNVSQSDTAATVVPTDEAARVWTWRRERSAIG
jgi:hypothetical protein